MSLVQVIDGVPAYSTIEEALAYGASYNINGYHTHVVGGQTVYMAGTTHDEITSIFRLGVVMGNFGASKKMILPFKLGLGGLIGDGRQYLSFIHIEDLLNAYEFIFENKQCSGIYNLTTSQPTTNYGLTKALGKTLHRPTIFPIPKFVLKLVFGEGSTILTNGQCAKPQRLIKSGFKFKFETIEDTIKNLLLKN